MKWLWLLPAIAVALVWWTLWLARVDHTKWEFRAGKINASDRDRQVFTRWITAHIGAAVILVLAVMAIATS